MSKMKIGLKYWLSILLFVILLSVQVVFLLKNRSFEFKYAEYGSIAQSLVHGEGFSSPFYTESGPTAWMPPFLVYFTYFFFFFFGNGLFTFLLLTIIKFLTYSLSFILLLKTLEYCKIKQSPIVIWLLFVLYLFMSIYQNFKTVNDYWLFSLLICVFTYAYIRYKSNGSRKGFLLLLSCFFLAPLISPGLAVSFAAVAVFDYFYGVIREISVGLKPMAWIRQFFIDCFKNVKYLSQLSLLGLAMIISIFLWTYRNYEVFHKFIPIKSNMWFEFYMSNVIEPEGLLTQTTLIKVHPMTNAVVFQDYAKSGEIDWIKKYELVSREYKEKHKEEYHHKIWNRFINAFVFIEIDDDVISTSIFQKISASDSSKLAENKMVIGGIWTVINDNEESIKSKINQLHFDTPDIIIADWERARRELDGKNRSIFHRFRSFLMTLLPSFCILMLLFVKRMRTNILYRISVVFYLSYLFPFILISHQMRYQRPLFFIQIVLIYLVFVWVVERVSAPSTP